MAQIERRELQRNGRERRLEELLADANRQLLDRDAALLELTRVGEREFALTKERLVWVERELARHVRLVEELNRALADVQASRVWRLAERYRRLRDRLKAVLAR
jgi:uncharacterized coiled-coil protein SlyX